MSEPTILTHRAFESFNVLPEPVLIYEQATLGILVANSAACEWLGYSQDALTAMSITDIRLPTGSPAIQDEDQKTEDNSLSNRTWKLKSQSGATLEGSVKSRHILFENQASVLVSIHDVTRPETEPDSSELTRTVTRLQEQEARLRTAENLLSLAGEKVRLGGWRVELDPQRIIWTPETAAIHELPPDTSLTIEEALDYYAPEHYERIAAAFWNCAQHGKDMDELCQLVTAKGNRIWVRALGSAERDEQGSITAVQGAFQDVNDFVETQQHAANISRQHIQTLESISDAFMTLDRDWHLTYLNRQAETLLQRERHELLGKHIWTEFPDAVGSTFQTQYELARATGEVTRFHEYFPPLETWFEVSAYPVPEGLAIYFRDVTADRARTEQLRLLEAAVARQNDILLITEARPIEPPDGPRVVYVNDAFVNRTGYGKDEIIGKTPRILQGPRTDQAELKRIRKALERWQPVRSELINYTKSGDEFWLELDIVPLTNDDGDYTYWVAVERDVTDRKLAEEAKRLSDERFELVTRATSDVVWDWNLKTDHVWWSDGLETLFGYSAAEMEPGIESWLDRVHPDDRERVFEGVHEALDGDDTNWSDEYRFLRADGTVATVLDRGFIIRNESGEVIRTLGSMIDVTEQRNLEHRVQESQKLEAMGQLTGGVAHDFNNLLTIILGNAEELAEELNNREDLRAMAKMTADAAVRGAELTSRLLAFARKQTLQPVTTGIIQLIQGIEGLVRRTLGEDIDIQFVHDTELWNTEIDTGQFEVALLNLVINARHAMPEGGKLTIETENITLDEDNTAWDLPAGQYVMVSVSDTGVGMDAETISHAFDPFYTTRETGDGSGLGLSMVFGFTKQSLGHVKIYSRPGEGTAVKMYFPRSTSAVDAQELPEPVQRIKGGNEHVLVVEDDDLVREHVTAQLKGLGYRVTNTNTGPRALEVLKNRDDIDLVLTDIVMPGGLNGRELADEAMKLKPTLRILFTSGYSENALTHHGRLDHNVELLSKPYRRSELASKVRKVLQ